LKRSRGRIRIEANLPALYRLNEDRTGNEGQEAGNRKQETGDRKQNRKKDIEKGYELRLTSCHLSSQGGRNRKQGIGKRKQETEQEEGI
jgi:hypothetical protein